MDSTRTIGREPPRADPPRLCQHLPPMRDDDRAVLRQSRDAAVPVPRLDIGLDGSLRKAPRSEREAGFDRGDSSPADIQRRLYDAIM